MSTEVQIILSKYVNELEKIYGTYLKEVILYGSYARGDFSKDSDIDIRPIAKSKEHFEQWVDVYPFYKNIKRDGVYLYKKMEGGTQNA